MKKMFPILSTVASALLVLATAPGAVDAQDDECGLCTDYIETEQHTATGSNDPDEWLAGRVDGWHTWKVDGDCLQKHGLCIVGQSQGEQFNVQELKEVIAEAVGDEDVTRLASLANSPAVRLVASRAAIQITGCDGETIVGHFPVDRYLLSAVETTAAELADSNDS
ncbi:MAG: hypothetical protein F4187_07900 [Gemmatimonadetes bacterium]|nr:hypothetical protein [Gemmatimonadota bacterium]